jgi:hypothetical protein
MIQEGRYGNSLQKETVIGKALPSLDISLLYALNHVECLKQFSQWYFFRLLYTNKSNPHL